MTCRNCSDQREFPSPQNDCPNQMGFTSQMISISRIRMRKFCSLSATLSLCLAPSALVLHAQQTPGRQDLVVLDHATGFTALANGVAIADGSAREEITALRDNVIRVRIVPTGTLPENASWAVLPDALRSHVNVKL